MNEPSVSRKSGTIVIRSKISTGQQEEPNLSGVGGSSLGRESTVIQFVCINVRFNLARNLKPDTFSFHDSVSDM